MAYARVFHRRLASIFFEDRHRLLNNRVLFNIGARSMHWKTEAEHEDQDPKPATDNSHAPEKFAENASNNTSKESNAKRIAISDLKTSARHDLAMVFTCKVCGTRSVKTACRESYDKGVVIVRCEGCNNLHLIADNLGWFGEPGNIESLLLSRGEQVRKGSVDSLNLTLEDLIGTKSS